MLSKKIRNFLLFGVIAALLLAVGYWNISPERFLDQPVAQVDEGAIDYYATNAYSVQFLPDGKVQYEMNVGQGRAPEGHRSDPADQPGLESCTAAPNSPGTSPASVARSTRTAPKWN